MPAKAGICLIRAIAFPDRTGTGSSFCRRYGLKRLVLVERHGSMIDAIVREKALKAWQRGWKIRLIEEANPGWDDLFDRIL